MEIIQRPKGCNDVYDDYGRNILYIRSLVEKIANNYNFNYFRNKKIGGSSRIIGNYFLVKFSFTIGKNDNQLIEFQSLNYSVTEY